MKTQNGLIITNFEEIHDYFRIVRDVSDISDSAYEQSYRKAREYGIDRRDVYREGYIEKSVRINGKSLFDERRLR